MTRFVQPSSSNPLDRSRLFLPRLESPLYPEAASHFYRPDLGDGDPFASAYAALPGEAVGRHDEDRGMRCMGFFDRFKGPKEPKEPKGPKAGERVLLPSGAIELPSGIVTPGIPPDVSRMPQGIVPLMPRLKIGHIFSQAAYVERDGKVTDLPENVLVAFIAAPAKRVIAELSNINRWAEWHSYFSYSHAEPGSKPDDLIQRFRLKLPANNPLLKIPGLSRLRHIDSQVWVVIRRAGSNWQAEGHLHQAEDLELEWGHIGLKLDDLYWTVYDEGEGSILIYGINTLPDVWGAGMAAKQMIKETIEHANRDIVRSLANRSFDSTWTRDIDQPIPGDPAETILEYPYRTTL